MTTRLQMLLLVTAVVVGWGYGCGRTSLDDGFGATGDLGGATGTGTGGGGGGSGMGGGGGSNVPNPCGATTCKAGSEVCCTRFGASGQPTQSCVPASMPNACNNGISTACVSAANCGSGLGCCASVTSASSVSTSCGPVKQCVGITEFVLCRTASECPATLPRCCLAIQGLGACAPPGSQCAAPP